MRLVTLSQPLAAAAIQALLATAPLPAQQPPTHVSPLEANAGLGNVNNSYPFAIGPNSYQQVHSRGSFSSSSPVAFTQMVFRNARGFLNQQGYLFMAQSPNDAAAASTVYAANIAPGTEVPVLLRKMVSLPQISDNSWAITFPFDVPFVFTGTTDVSWRALVYGNSNGNQSFRYQLDAFSGQGTTAITSALSGCKSANGTAAATHTIFAPSLKLGESIQFAGNSFDTTGSLPAVLTIGTSASAWGGVPLPFDLGALGAPGCWIVSDAAVQLPSTTAAGAVTILVPLPIDYALSGATFYSQYLFVSAAANALGLFTSNGRTDTIGIPYGVTRIFAGLTATSGSRDRFFGLAVGFN